MAEDWRSRIYQTYNLIGSWIGQPEVLAPIDDGGPGPTPGPLPLPVPPVLIDSDGCAALDGVEAFVANHGPVAKVMQLTLAGPDPVEIRVPIPRKFHLNSALPLIAGDLKEKVGMSIAAADLHQSRAYRYKAAPFYKPWLKWVEDSVIDGAVASKLSDADTVKMIVGRTRRIESGDSQPHFQFLGAVDLAAGA